VAAAFGDFASLTDAFMTAAVDPSRWDTAMDAAARATGSFGAILVPIRGCTPAVPTSASMQAVMDNYFCDGWAQRDERYRCSDLHAKRRRERIRLHDPRGNGAQRLLPGASSSFGLRWFAGVKVGDGEDVWGLSLQRSAEQGPFSPRELQRLAQLSRCLAGAAELAGAFGSARLDAALDAFEASRMAVAMIDRSGEVLRLNRLAERLLGPDLQIVRRRIVSSSRDATCALDRALRELLWSRGPNAFQPPVVLPRWIGRPIIAYPSRLSSAVSEAFAFCRGLVVFVDLETKANLIAGDLRRVFNLTTAEARLADCLLCEESLRAAAESLSVATSTARSQLKAIYQKTSSTHSQGQLIALIARLGTPHRPDVA
jgi:PAS domain-containing protein